jgi:acid phosphatase family membrane protein YuiD
MALALSQRAGAIRVFLENPIFLSAIWSWFFAQLVKTVIYLLRSRKKSLRDTFETLIWRTGGMPSSHSALVASMAVSVALNDGIDSNLFIVTLMLAVIIIRDSLGVRRSSGNQSRILNVLGRQFSEKFKTEFHPVKEVNGHTPLEVAVGILLGIFIASAYHFL